MLCVSIAYFQNICTMNKLFLRMGNIQYNSLLQLLLWAEIVCMSTFLLTAISSTGMKTSITLTTDHFIAIVFLCQDTKRWFNDT